MSPYIFSCFKPKTIKNSKTEIIYEHFINFRLDEQHAVNLFIDLDY